MKKVLILSYYFHPINAVGTPRIMSWANEFSKSGLMPTVITRHWTGNEINWADFITENHTPLSHQKKSNYEVYYLPYVNKIPKIINRNKLLSKAWHLLQLMTGNFTPEANGHQAYNTFCRELLAKHNYDAILVSAPPLNLIRLASGLSNDFSIPLVVDFRDIWNNSLTINKSIDGLKRKFTNKMEELHIKKWLKNASLVTTVSSALEQEVKRIYKGKTAIITNGYEDYIFKHIRHTKSPSPRFEFSSIGTIYEKQNVSILIEGLKKFYQLLENKDEFKLNLIGIEGIPSIAGLLRKELYMYNPLLTHRIPREQLDQYYKMSHVLFIPAWKNYKGIYTAKIFEYVGSGRVIMAAPGDDDVVDQLIKETNTGYIANTVEEFVQTLNNLFSLWKKNGEVAMAVNMDKVKYYSRENQAEILSKEILAVCN